MGKKKKFLKEKKRVKMEIRYWEKLLSNPKVQEQIKEAMKDFHVKED